MRDVQYLQLLAEQYPSIEAVSNAIVGLNATLRLPKGTEYYFSDLHGEHEAFIHLLRSGSGVIRRKIDDLFGQSMLECDRDELASIIYYPKRNLARKRRRSPDSFNEWCEITINRLVLVCREVSRKYTRKRVHRGMDAKYEFILDELLLTDDTDADKRRYFREIIDTVLVAGIAEPLIIALCHLIQQLTVDKLHIIGDLFDRGPRADKILVELMKHQNVDIQWGNHDIDWMGAMAGNRVCMMNVLRIATSYNSFDVIEDGYGINLRPLSMFAAQVYGDDPCERFQPHVLDENILDPIDPQQAARMHKAVAVIMFKLEGQLLARHPEYGMQARMLLGKVDFADGTITLDGKTHEMLDTRFPTVDPEDPYRLTPEEHELVEGLYQSFQHSAQLASHIDFIYNHGSMYKVINNNLLYHGCIPMTESGEFDVVTLGGSSYSGKSLLDYLDKRARQAYYAGDADSADLMWYLWCGAKSPLFGRDRMTTFERYFIADKSTYTETRSFYYRAYEDAAVCDKILREFGLDPAHSHIINGHVPVKHGENPVKAGGKLFVIDGGISKAYQSTTGIAGYTLIFDSHDLQLAEHRPFRPATSEVTASTFTSIRVVEKMPHRLLIEDTDAGEEIRSKIGALGELLQAYRDGVLRPRQ
ncbi:MAG: fructose-1,6-bisphosphatase [Clostridiaceae bacterium]|nr:fructose-1,6-bisphosphatase [Clostridiaceae bacterium]NBI83874.1 fructose-1,6-bisphosphatase [Clostridiaceae bacterium]RKJ76840.1 fructose-1,6-bisphosphatase [Butyricicoccus sp. 1XD8-22]